MGGMHRNIMCIRVNLVLVTKYIWIVHLHSKYHIHHNCSDSILFESHLVKKCMGNIYDCYSKHMATCVICYAYQSPFCFKRSDVSVVISAFFTTQTYLPNGWVSFAAMLIVSILVLVVEMILSFLIHEMLLVGYPPSVMQLRVVFSLSQRADRFD